jgi:hypothetical protein
MVYAELMKFSLSLILFSALAISALGKNTRGRLPRFEDYPAKEFSSGVLAAPKIVTPAQRMYRTRIREGVEKGWGVYRDGKDLKGPNFAGKMIVVRWGCGAPCLMMAMVDAETGEVYLPPLSVANTFALPLSCIGRNVVSSNPEITFRQDSLLMVIRATPDCNKENHHSYAHYFVWKENHWNLLYRDPLD